MRGSDSPPSRKKHTGINSRSWHLAKVPIRKITTKRDRPRREKRKFRRQGWNKNINRFVPRMRRGKMGSGKRSRTIVRKMHAHSRGRVLSRTRKIHRIRAANRYASQRRPRRYVGGFDLSAIFARAQNEQTNERTNERTNEITCVRKVRTWNVRRGRFVVGTCNDAVCAGIDPRACRRNGIFRTTPVRGMAITLVTELHRRLQRQLNRARSAFISIAWEQ